MTIVLSGCGSDPETNFKKACEFYKRGNRVRAEELVRKTVAVRPDFLPAYLLLARIAKDTKDEDSAVLNYRNAFDIIRKREFKHREEDLVAREDDLRLQWEEAPFALAEAEFRSENYNRAVFYYNTILEHVDDAFWKKKAHDGKQVAQEFFQYKRNLRRLRNQNYKNPDDPRVKAELALLFSDMASALSRMGDTKRIAEFLAMAAEWRRQAYEKLGDLYDASPEVKLPQTEAILAFTESRESLIRGKSDEAIEKAKEACEKDPNQAKYQFAVASLLRVQSQQDPDGPDRTEEILAYAKRAVELEPNVWRYQMFYAGLLRELGRLEDSYKVLLRVRDITSDKAVLGEVDEMLSALEEAIAASK